MHEGGVAAVKSNGLRNSFLWGAYRVQTLRRLAGGAATKPSGMVLMPP
jgi:hypothetical protein